MLSIGGANKGDNTGLESIKVQRAFTLFLQIKVITIFTSLVSKGQHKIYHCQGTRMLPKKQTKQLVGTQTV